MTFRSFLGNQTIFIFVFGHFWGTEQYSYSYSVIKTLFAHLCSRFRHCMVQVSGTIVSGALLVRFSDSLALGSGLGNLTRPCPRLHISRTTTCIFSGCPSCGLVEGMEDALETQVLARFCWCPIYGRTCKTPKGKSFHYMTGKQPDRFRKVYFYSWKRTLDQVYFACRTHLGTVCVWPIDQGLQIWVNFRWEQF